MIALLTTLTLSTLSTSPIYVILDMQGPTTSNPKTLSGLSDYAESVLGQKGFKIAPRGKLKKKLDLARFETFKARYNEQTRSQLGKEIAPSHAVALKLIQVGSQCRLSAQLLNLQTALSEQSLVAPSGCGDDALLLGLETLLSKLAPSKSEPPANPITTPTDPCLRTKRCAKARYLKTHPYVLGGRFPDGRYANAPRITVGRCSAERAQVFVNGKRVARFTGPHQAGSKLKALIKAGKCL